jgi:hypothetical protein
MAVAAATTASTAQSILKRMDTGRFDIWVPDDFADLGSRNVIDVTLLRLHEAQKISKAGHGLYYKPKLNTLTKRPRTASVAGIVDAITRRNGAPYIVDGMTAANDLGWETAVPAKNIVYTTSRLKPVAVGNSEIVFKTVAPSKLFWAGRPGMRVVQALHYYQAKLSSERSRLVRLLSEQLADPQHGPTLLSDLRAGFQTMPIWMQEFTRPLLFSTTSANVTDDAHFPSRTTDESPL